MTDDSRPPFILPDSVLKRRRGLLEAAMPEAPPRQWAEHLELLTAEGELTSVDDMLALMQRELDRLQNQITDEEPDRHSETVLAAAMAEVLEARAGSQQRESRQEVYFALLLGYLYGRLTKPGMKQESETAIELLQGQLQIQQVQSELQADRESRSTGGKKSRKMSLDEFEEAWLEWVKAGSPGTKAKFDLDMAERFGVSEENIERERLKLQRELAALDKEMRK